MSLESVKLLRDSARENIENFCKRHNESFDEVWKYIDNKIDKHNLLEPMEYYRRLYNESLKYV